MELLNILRNVPGSIKQNFKNREYRKGEMLVLQGDKAEDFFVLLSGSTKLYHDSEEGKRYTLTIFYAGDYFGENVLLENDIRLFSVQAIQDTRAVLVHRALLKKWLESDNRFALYLLHETSKRLKQSGEKFVLTQLYPLKSRILRLIHSWALESGETTLRLSSSNLAEELGVATRSVQRVLKELKDRGIIDYSRGLLKIYSKRELANFISLDGD